MRSYHIFQLFSLWGGAQSTKSLRANGSKRSRGELPPTPRLSFALCPQRPPSSSPATPQSDYESLARERITAFALTADVVKLTDEEAEWLCGVPGEKALRDPSCLRSFFPAAKVGWVGALLCVWGGGSKGQGGGGWVCEHCIYVFPV